MIGEASSAPSHTAIISLPRNGLSLPKSGSEWINSGKVGRPDVLFSRRWSRLTIASHLSSCSMVNLGISFPHSDITSSQTAKKNGISQGQARPKDATKDSAPEIAPLTDPLHTEVNPWRETAS